MTDNKNKTSKQGAALLVVLFIVWSEKESRQILIIKNI
jgi:hypothetical protein